MAWNWYLKKSWVDQEDGIEGVNIHYTWTPLEESPDWSKHRETRSMPLNPSLMEGVGVAFSLDVRDPTHLIRERDKILKPPNIRSKVLKLPNEVYDERTGAWSGNYLFHSYFEVFQNGKRLNTSLFTEEIASKEIVYVDYEGQLMGTCAYYSVYDWDCPTYANTDDPRFLEMYGDDNEFRGNTIYHYPDKERWYREKYSMMKAIPLPWYWHSKLVAPRWVPVHQMWHVANLSLQEGERFEDWVGYTVHVL